jgi:CheY-like chemotaxis protein
MTDQKHILIIEDDMLMMRVFEKQFRLSGFEVEILTNGEEAVNRLTTLGYTPVAIVLDVMMPKVSGFDVLDSIQKTPALASVPVFVLTNYDSKDGPEHALTKGATKYFLKSEHDPEEIVAEVKKHVG